MLDLAAAPEVRARHELVKACREAMKVGSLSFFLAARLLGKRQREATLMLYSWCRYCDDTVDQAGPVSLEQQHLGLDELRRATWIAMHRRQYAPASKPVLQAFSCLTNEHRIPDEYPQELLNGMEMDVLQQRYETFDDLRLYCFRVAGTVGLMFSHIVDVSDPLALRHACDLGSAMQLSNIARDVIEDAAMGRVYLPLAWLRDAGIDPHDVANPIYREPLANVVAMLLDKADEYYASGEFGLKYLPWRAACAVAVARHVYGEIGQLVRTRGPWAWDKRAIVSPGRKLILVGRGLVQVLGGIASRMKHPWQKTTLVGVWRFGHE